MTALAGSFSLAVALFAGLTSTLLWARVARTGSADPSAARLATWLLLAGSAGACAALEWALVGGDFSLRYVAEQSSRATPWPYRVSALWSALDGSLLLWLLVLSGYAVLVSRGRGGSSPLQAWATSVVSAVAVCFTTMTLLGAGPFDRLRPAALDGPGPNPLLADHPAMLVHPPLLYAGYVGLVVPFGYAVAALLTGDASHAWLRLTRRAVLLAWTCLTAGILLGAWWSYAVLGWGGYWAWDPVENASLLPWLTSTALLHSALVQRRRRTSQAWNVGLAAASFLLVCTGTFLTRSGVVASVHAFSTSPLGPLLLGFLVVAVAVVVGLLIWRADLLEPSDRPAEQLAAADQGTSPVGREGLLRLNNLLLVGLAVCLLVGTLAPAVLRAVQGVDVSVGTPYYDRVAVPVALCLLVLMVLGPLARWRGDEPLDLLRRAAGPAAAAAVTVAVLGFAGAHGVAAVLTIGLAVAVAVTSLRVLWRGGRRPAGRRAILGAHVAHLGLAVAAVGVAGSSAWATTAEATLAPGGQARFGADVVRLDRVTRHADPRRMRTAATVTVLRDGRSVVHARPALAYYPGRDTTVAVPAVTHRATGDLYLTLLAVEQDESGATVRLTHEPLVSLLWAGGALVVAGGVLATLGAAARRRPKRAAEPDPSGAARLPTSIARGTPPAPREPEVVG